jgi:hypothetical protein
MLKGGAMELTRDARDEIRGDSQVDERTAHARRLYAEMAPQFSRGPRESEGRFYVPDSDCDFPPTVHPGRDLFTASLLVLVILTFVVWGGLNLILLALTALL